MFRSLLAVLVGYAVLAAVIGLLFYLWLGAQPDTPPSRKFLFVALGVGFVAAVAGGWVTALLAPGKRWRHVQGLVALILVMAAVDLIGMDSVNLIWMAGQEPRWFQLGLLAAAVAGVVLGGSLKRGGRL